MGQPIYHGALPGGGGLGLAGRGALRCLRFAIQGSPHMGAEVYIADFKGGADFPKDARGRFITGDGTVFQGYLFDEEQL